jgi:hypothetical protein
MEEEVEFIYEMLHSHSPTCERVWLPKGPPKFAQVCMPTPACSPPFVVCSRLACAQPRDGVAALKQRLGHERVSIVNPFTLTQERQTTCSGLYYAYIHPVLTSFLTFTSQDVYGLTPLRRAARHQLYGRCCCAVLT